MIPKTIHWCWFGNGKKSRKVLECVDSWKRVHADFEIVEWNETNFDVEANKYLKEQFEAKRWAHLSDLARLMIVREHGGVYLDADVEAIRPYGELMERSAFFGFENDFYVSTGLGFGAERNSPVLDLMIEEYDRAFADDEATPINCPILNSRALDKMGLKRDGSMQVLEGNVLILPPDWLNPMDDATGKTTITQNTLSIHMFAASWRSGRGNARRAVTRRLHRLFGTDFFRKHEYER